MLGYPSPRSVVSPTPTRSKVDAEIKKDLWQDHQHVIFKKRSHVHLERLNQNAISDSFPSSVSSCLPSQERSYPRSTSWFKPMLLRSSRKKTTSTLGATMHKKEFAENGSEMPLNARMKHSKWMGIFESGSQWNERLLPDASWNPTGSRRPWMNHLLPLGMKETSLFPRNPSNHEHPSERDRRVMVAMAMTRFELVTF